MSETFFKNNFSHRLFKFTLVQKNNSLKLPEFERNESLGEFVLFYSTETPGLRLEANSNKTFFFLGTIFEMNHLDPQLSIGHYVGFCLNHLDQSVTIFRSRNSCIAIYYDNSLLTPVVFGDIFSLASNQNFSYELDPHLLCDFLNNGIVSTGLTIFKKIHQLPFQKQLLLNRGGTTLLEEKEFVVDGSILRSGERLFEFIMERFSAWFRYMHFNSIAVSGGTDSRLLFSTLLLFPPSKKTNLHSRLHPKLNEDQDADVSIAKKLAQVVKQPHQIQKTSIFPSAYLSQEEPAVPPILSGLYGGEFLGGEILNLVAPHLLGFDKDATFSQALRTTSQMFTCDFYSGAWSLPCIHHNLTVTPFWDSHLMALLLQTPTDLVKNYRLYDLIFDFLPEELKKVPVVSMLTDYHPRWRQTLPGMNPKLQPSNQTQNFPQEFFNFCRDHDLNIDSTTVGRRNTLYSLLKNFNFI